MEPSEESSPKFHLTTNGSQSLKIKTASLPGCFRITEIFMMGIGFLRGKKIFRVREASLIIGSSKTITGNRLLATHYRINN
jgi:hypothetical protein